MSGSTGLVTVTQNTQGGMPLQSKHYHVTVDSTRTESTELYGSQPLVSQAVRQVEDLATAIETESKRARQAEERRYGLDSECATLSTQMGYFERQAEQQSMLLEALAQRERGWRDQRDRMDTRVVLVVLIILTRCVVVIYSNFHIGTRLFPRFPAERVQASAQAGQAPISTILPTHTISGIFHEATPAAQLVTPGSIMTEFRLPVLAHPAKPDA